MQILQSIPANTVALEGAVWTGSQFLSTRGDGQPIHPFTSIRTKQGTALWPQFAPPRIGNTAKAKGARRSINTGDAELWLECEVAGTTAASAPVINYSQIGQTVVDGTVTWRVKGLHAFKGFSNWPARTNLVLQSQAWSSGAWANGTPAFTVISNNHIAPDGTMSADSLVANGGNPAFAQAATATATTLTYSCFAKLGVAGAPANYSFLFRNSTTATNFDLGSLNTTTGVITGTGWTVQRVNNSWVRVIYTRSTGITIGDLMTVYAGWTGGPIANETIVTWGAQLEAAAFASPYIATTTATVTRAATNLSLPTAGVIRENDFGVDMWVIPGGDVGAVESTIFGTSVDATNFLSIQGTNATLRARKYISGVEVASVSVNITHTIGTPMRVQAVYSATTGVQLRVRPLGGAFPAWTTVANFVACPIATTLAIGSRGSNLHFPGNIPATRFILHSDPKAELERLAAIDDAWVAGQI